MINSIDWIAPGGDSIGKGTAEAAGIPHSCKVGRMPDAVLAAIKEVAPFIRGKNVILSCGLSNNPDGRSYVEQQIVSLQTAEAMRIVLLGVGPGVREGTNEWLAYLAARSGPQVIFAGPLAPPACTMWQTGDLPGVHPVDYSEVVKQIEAALAA